MSQQKPGISKEQVVIMHNQGDSGAEIARKLGVSRSRISQILTTQGIFFKSKVKEKILSSIPQIMNMRHQHMTWKQIASMLGVAYNDLVYHLPKRNRIARTKKGYKYCNYCKKILPVSKFYPKRVLISPGTMPYSTYCKTCNSIRHPERKAAKSVS